MSNNSSMARIHENTSLLCGKDPVYYTNIIGIVVDWVIFLVGLPEVCLACYALLCLLKKDRVAPIFVINLLLSDLMQIGVTAMRHEAKNRKKVLGVLSLMLGTYAVLFFPFSFRNLYCSLKGDDVSDAEDSVRDLSSILTSALVYLSPLIDSLIYIFLRRDIKDTVEAFPCCKTPLMKLREFQDRLTDTSQTETAL